MMGRSYLLLTISPKSDIQDALTLYVSPPPIERTIVYHGPECLITARLKQRTNAFLCESVREETMAIEKSNEGINTGPSRREILVRGSKVVAGIGVATLLGNLQASLSKSYGMGPAATNLLDSLTPARTALLVIDMQRDFLSPKGYAAQAGLDITPLVAAIAPIQKLLSVARPAGLVFPRFSGHRWLSERPAVRTPQG